MKFCGNFFPTTTKTFFLKLMNKLMFPVKDNPKILCLYKQIKITLPMIIAYCHISYYSKMWDVDIAKLITLANYRYTSRLPMSRSSSGNSIITFSATPPHYNSASLNQPLFFYLNPCMLNLSLQISCWQPQDWPCYLSSLVGRQKVS